MDWCIERFYGLQIIPYPLISFLKAQVSFWQRREKVCIRWQLNWLEIIHTIILMMVWGYSFFMDWNFYDFSKLKRCLFYNHFCSIYIVVRIFSSCFFFGLEEIRGDRRRIWLWATPIFYYGYLLWICSF